MSKELYVLERGDFGNSCVHHHQEEIHDEVAMATQHEISIFAQLLKPKEQNERCW